MNEPAYLEGAAAKAAGRGKGTNPYAKLPRNPNIRLWNMGWTAQAKKERADAQEA